MVRLRWQWPMKCGCFENSIYSILSPEGFASILWKDSHKAKEAAAVMRLTAADLQKHGMVERVFEEPEDLTHRDTAGTDTENGQMYENIFQKTAGNDRG